MKHKWRRALPQIAALLIGLNAIPAHADPAPAAGIIGAWEVKLDYEGNQIPARLTFEMNDGHLTGVWKSPRGQGVLENVEFEEGELSFLRRLSFEDEQFELQYKGRVEGDRLQGKFTTPIGELVANGVRAQATLVEPAPEPVPGDGDVMIRGVWALTIELEDGSTSQGRLVIIGNESEISGHLKTELGESDIDEIRIDGHRITFTTEVDLGGVKIPWSVEGSIAGDTFEGRVIVAFEEQKMEMPVKGRRIGNAPLTGAVNLPGAWELTGQLADGSTSLSRLEVKQDGEGLSAVLKTEIGDARIGALEIDGNLLSFKAAIDMGGTDVPLAFTGSTGGDRIEGTAKITIDGQEIEVPLIGIRLSGSGAPETPRLTGTWELTATLPDGATRQSVLKIMETDGALTGVLETENGKITLDEIVIEGAGLRFKARIDRQGVEVPLEVTGQVEGSRLTAIARLSLDGQTLEVPLTGVRAD